MIKVLKPGLLTSIQDLGRYGYQKYGVIASGVMDPFSHRVANLLVGNDENCPTMEISLLGPVIEFQQDAIISICGGNLTPTIDYKPIYMWRTIFVKKGSELRFGPAETGCRAYLAVAGGFDIPIIMDSYSTYLRGEIGGYHGRALQAGDEVAFGDSSERANRIMDKLVKANRDSSQSFMDANWSVATEMLPELTGRSAVRVTKGRQYELFSEESQKQFQAESFRVSTQSDRMGYRLEGPALHLKEPEELISEAVSFGSVQVPSDGNPIVLLADRQTTGGYPKIAQVATVDLPCMAQLKPGEAVRFEFINHSEAQRLYLAREQYMRSLKNGILLKIGRN
ncbi:5-oxoprolinase subunit C family protein [Salinibacillus xinjiangensis]|uniref:5-oxoprolinase/urea amidolyase family protein n=1 Tax=Salinibacillus xinjiangensis TaxID=1229268 RepID=A0A6G1X5M7_9BACI|nr:biotin-dependent carboxyltransferase family protein [Salinibacillus xinjiangensis]MRG86301.1 5-oxoprolinase/urea amidolyase family protein [Salinibacillus xinjiangensis]